MQSSGKPDILLLRPFGSDLTAAMADRFVLHACQEDIDTEAVLAAVGPRIRGVAAGGKTRVDAALLAKLPRVEIVANFGVGYDAIDVAEARRRGVLVTNTPDVLTDEVADLALGLLLATVRHIPQGDRYLRAGRWREADFPLSATLRGRTVGILGLGRIGRAIALRLDAFRVAIVYHGRREQPGVDYPFFDDLVAMARASDVLMIVAPGTPDTRHLVGAAVLEALGPDGIVINVARGSLVDEQALIAALTAGTIRSAGLDVFADEPHVPEALTRLDHVVLLPHVGSASHHTRHRMGSLVVDNLLSWFDGKGPLTPVPETPWEPARR